MKVDRPVVRAADLDRVVLLVGEPMDKLKTKSPWVVAIHPLRDDGDIRVEQVKGKSQSQSDLPARPAIRGTT